MDEIQLMRPAISKALENMRINAETNFTSPSSNLASNEATTATFTPDQASIST